MSFILEALKRADRERRLERAPDLSAVYEESNLPRHDRFRTWLWLSGFLLVAVIVVGLMLWPEGPDPAKSPLSKDKTASLSLPTQETTDKEKSRPVSLARSNDGLQGKRIQGEASGTQPVQRPLPTAKPARPIRSMKEKTAPAKTKSKPVKKASEPKPVSTAGKISAPRPSPVAAVGKGKSVQPSPSVSSSPEKASKESATSDRSKEGEKPVEAKVVRHGESHSTPAAKEQVIRKRTVKSIPLISELPRKIKEKLGRLQINVHSYSRDPAERLVFINMHSYKVGDKIGEGGPLLKEITSDGVIIDYGEGEARLQVGR